MQENDSAFKTNDIRGIYPTEINDKLAYKLGQAIVYLFKTKTIVVGRDKRKSSPCLFSNLVKGIISQGCDVIDIGYTNTPLFYYSVGELKSDFGVMITASHNPGKYNGFKLIKKGVIPSSIEEIQKLKDIVNTRIFLQVKNPGKIIKRNISKKYIKELLGYSKIKKKLKVVVDTGNGMSYPTVSKVFSKLPITTIYINKNINMINPKHEANPLKIETLKELQNTVLKKKADLGIAFDGDGDRIGFVDEKGNIIPMDLITAFLSKIILNEKPKSKIIFDIRSSNIVKETISSCGGVPQEYMVGHSLIKRRMREISSPFGGEVSGHYYFSKFYYSEAPIFVAIEIMNAIDKQSISKLLKPFKKYYKTPEINFKVNNPDRILLLLKNNYSSGRVNLVDGLKIEFPDWWFNVRTSHTEPLLRLNLEANSKALMVKKQAEIERIIKH